MAELNMLQAEGYPGFVTGFGDTSREENTLRVPFFKGDLLEKSMTQEMKAEGERGVHCVTLFSPMRLGNCCFAFFSLKNILPLPTCSSRKGAEAAASQGTSARQTARYGKPDLSEGRLLAHIIGIYNAQTLGHPGLSSLRKHAFKESTLSWLSVPGLAAIQYFLFEFGYTSQTLLG